jgi:hypothetical protein
MDDYRKRRVDSEEYGHPDRADDRFPDGQSFPPMDLMERRRLLKERFKGD